VHLPEKTGGDVSDVADAHVDEFTSANGAAHWCTILR
jgi:hypothetical protein